MATRSPAPRARQPAKIPPADSPSDRLLPKSWWQWVLVYPTLAISLASAAPNWVSQLKAYSLGVRSVPEAEKQNALWQRNAACAALPFKGYMNPKHVQVDATICDSGDILVHAVTPDNASIFKWLALDDVVRPAPSGGGLFIPAANAATVSSRLTPAIASNASPEMVKAQFQVNVICQRMNGRYLIRRVATPQGCFDEVIDTYSGAVVQRNGAPCQHC